MSKEVVDLIINAFGITVVLGQVFLVLLILLYLFATFNKKSKKLSFFTNIISKNGLSFSFLVSASAVVGSLFLSQLAQIPPCDLCWYQRIFMFPLPIILGVALVHDDLKVTKYVVPLVVVGLVLATYHYLLQSIPSLPFPCTNEAVSCTTKEIELFSYLTIPLMSATAFLLILFFMIFPKRK